MHSTNASSGNPILPGRGVCDPHIRIFDDTAYLYATHDKSEANPGFRMEDWWIWSSKDLVEWKHECTLKPEVTYLGEGFDQCWATDAAKRNGKYYWYFSESWKATGVVVSDSPIGPWHDPLGKPLITQEDTSGLAAHDPGIFIDDDDTPYIIVGAWEFEIAELNDDMISLAEPLQKITIHNPQGILPDTTDDKAYIHKYNGIYYLSWGCYYAMSDNIYGPYECKGAFIQEACLNPAFRYAEETLPYKPASELLCSIVDHLRAKNRFSTWDRHGSFFEWRNQWYFICNDISRSQNSFFRDSSLCYIEYRDNGEIKPVNFTEAGVSLPSG